MNQPAGPDPAAQYQRDIQHGRLLFPDLPGLECDACAEHFYADPFILTEAFASVGISRNRSTEEMARTYFAELHRREGHDDEVITLHDGRPLRVHTEDACLAPPCPIHAPSDHRMASWPQDWSSDERRLERVCQHGVGHPDPDDLRVRLAADGREHDGCDGCCSAPTREST